MKSDRRRELFQRIQTLPGLSPEDRAALLGLLAETKRYGLVWEDKPEAAHEILRGKIPVFVEDAKRRIEASEEDAPHHVLIEGDNLHALAALQYTHAGKVDVIYIDPPYNTGNKDFQYNDDYVDKEDSFRHSKWLSFMERRLMCSRRILSDSGCLFISIDDNEQAQLKLLCDEIFGESNFVANIVWQKRTSPDSRKILGAAHDNIYVYAKKKESLALGVLPLTEEQMEKFRNPDEDPRGPWVSSDLTAQGYRPNQVYSIVTPAGNFYAPASGKCWKVVEAVYKRQLQEGRIWFGSEGKSMPRRKTYLKERKGVVPWTWWDNKAYGSNQDSKKEIVSVLGSDLFSTPKPVALVRKIIDIGCDSDATILDFFAGSGTTLHATMALNAEDGGKRQCILVTNNENGICEEVCYERNKRVIQGYRTPKGEDIPGLTANHLHYLKTELVDREPTTKNRRQLVKLAVDLIRLKENAWDRIAGLSTGKEVQAFQGKDFTLFVVVDVDRIPAVVEQVRSLPGKSKVYVLSPDADPFTADFEEVQDRLDLVALPEAIYRSLLPVWRTLPEPGTEAEVADA